MKRVGVIVTTTLGLVALLTGCEHEDEKLSNIERGKVCAEAGGSWRWTEWSGYKCEFNVEGETND